MEVTSYAAPGTRSPLDDVADIFRRSRDSVARTITLWARAIILNNEFEAVNLRGQFTDAVGESMALADLIGRRRTILELQALERGDKVAIKNSGCPVHGTPIHYDQVVIPNVTFEEAVADLIERTPELAPNAEAVSDLYSSRHAFAVARSSSPRITSKAQEILGRALFEGRTLAEGSLELQNMFDWSRAYADTVFNTNLATAYSAGRWRQVQDPDVQEVIGAFRYDAWNDQSVRPNHGAADGLIAGLNDPVWDRFTPPIGYNCRCSITMVTKFELERRNLIRDGQVIRFEPAGFSRAAPDPNFGRGRPDRRIYS